MTQEEILNEIKKCNDSPYYFATKYLVIKNHNNQSIPFITPLSEEEFNKIFKDYTYLNVKLLYNVVETSLSIETAK